MTWRVLPAPSGIVSPTCHVGTAVAHRLAGEGYPWGSARHALEAGEPGFVILAPRTRRAASPARGEPACPRAPAVYAMYAGEPPRTWVAYVGMASDLHGRLFQHFVRVDSSVVAAAAVRLDLDYIRYVDWWEHEQFTYGAGRHAAELVAFDVFEPLLRSRGIPRPRRSRAITTPGDPVRVVELR
jgi:hypothetical protein